MAAYNFDPYVKAAAAGMRRKIWPATTVLRQQQPRGCARYASTNKFNSLLSQVSVEPAAGSVNRGKIPPINDRTIKALRYLGLNVSIRSSRAQPEMRTPGLRTGSAVPSHAPRYSPTRIGRHRGQWSYHAIAVALCYTVTSPHCLHAHGRAKEGRSLPNKTSTSPGILDFRPKV